MKSDSPLLKIMFKIRDIIGENDRTVQTVENVLSSWNSAGQFCIVVAFEHFQLKGDKKVWTKEIWGLLLLQNMLLFYRWVPNQGYTLRIGCHILTLTRIVFFCGTHLETEQHLF